MPEPAAPQVDRHRRRGAAPLLRRMGAYTLIQIAAFIAPFVALPIVAREAGTHGWVTIGLAQAIGGMASVIITFGWWTLGPVEYSRLRTPAERHRLYRRSLTDRAVVGAVVMPIACIAAVAQSANGWVLVALVTVISATLPGFSPGWYFIASSSPTKLAIYETAPRVLASVVAGVGVVWTGDVMFYPVPMIIAPALAYLVALRRETPSVEGGRRRSSGAVLHDLRYQAPIAGSNIIGGFYSQLMAPYAALFIAAPQLVGYISGDRLYKASRFVVIAAANTFQPWVLETNERRRQFAAIGAHVFIGVSGFLATWLLLPPFSELLFGEALSVSRTLSAGFGAGFLFISLTTPLVRNVLIPHGRRFVPLVGTVTALAVALVTIPLTYHSLGVNSVALAIALSEGASCAVAVVASLPILRTMSRSVLTIPAET